MNSLSDTLQYLYNLKNRGIKLNLDRVFQFQAELDYPDRAYDTIHIAGTNGKGSVAHYLAALFRESGAMTGLYTSPHLVKFNERVQVNGKQIPDEFITRFIEKWRHSIDELKLTYFETTTLLAMDYFRASKADVVVLETGLGGRLDATNIVEPLISVITSIGLDHTDVLGDTLEEIALEKAGIMKTGIPCVIGKVAPEVLAALKIHADKVGTPITTSAAHYKSESVNIKRGETAFNLLDSKGNKHVTHLNMIGRQAATNAAIALTVFKLQEIYDLSLQNQMDAISQVNIPGRLEKVSAIPEIYYDVAHNYDSLKQLVKNLRKVFHGESLKFLLALGQSKDIVRIREIFSHENTIGIMLTDEMPMHPPDKWREVFPDLQITYYGTGSEAISNFKSDLLKSDIGIITGSHYIASDVYKVLNFSLDRNR